MPDAHVAYQVYQGAPIEGRGKQSTPPCVSTTGTPLSGRSLLKVVRSRLAGEFAFHPGCHAGELSDEITPKMIQAHVQCCRLAWFRELLCRSHRHEIVHFYDGEILSVTDHVRISIGQAQLPDAEFYSSLFM